MQKMQQPYYPAKENTTVLVLLQSEFKSSSNGLSICLAYLQLMYTASALPKLQRVRRYTSTNSFVPRCGASLRCAASQLNLRHCWQSNHLQHDLKRPQTTHPLSCCYTHLLLAKTKVSNLLLQFSRALSKLVILPERKVVSTKGKAVSIPAT